MSEHCSRCGELPDGEFHFPGDHGCSVFGPISPAVEDSLLLDWFLWDIRPDAIGEYEIWESIPEAEYAADARAAYLKAAREAIRRAIREEA
jgi:hypothetical protein